MKCRARFRARRFLNPVIVTAAMRHAEMYTIAIFHECEMCTNIHIMSQCKIISVTKRPPPATRSRLPLTKRRLPLMMLRRLPMTRPRPPMTRRPTHTTARARTTRRPTALATTLWHPTMTAAKNGTPSYFAFRFRERKIMTKRSLLT